MLPKSAKPPTGGVANPALQVRLIDQQEELLERPNFVRLKFLGTGVKGAKSPPPKRSTKDVRVHSLEELSTVVDDWLGAPGSWQLSTAANWPLAVDTLLRPSSKQCPIVVNIRNTQEDGLDQALHRQLELEAKMQREVERRQAEVGRCLRRIDDLERSILEVKNSRRGELHVQSTAGAKQAAMRQFRKCLANLGLSSFVPGVAVVGTCLVVYLLLSISSEVVSQGILTQKALAQDESVITWMQIVLRSAGGDELPRKLTFLEGNVSKLHKNLDAQVNRLEAQVIGNMQDVKDAVQSVANFSVEVSREEYSESKFRRKEDLRFKHSLEDEKGKLGNITEIAEESHKKAIHAEAFAHDLARRQAREGAYVNRSLGKQAVGLESLNRTIEKAFVMLREKAAELADLKKKSQAMEEGLKRVNRSALAAMSAASAVNASAKERHLRRAEREAREAMEEASTLGSINATAVAAQQEAAQAAKDIASVNQTVNSNMQNGTEELDDVTTKLTAVTQQNHDTDLKLEQQLGGLKSDIAHHRVHFKRDLNQVEQLATATAQDLSDLNASVTRQKAHTWQGLHQVETKASKAEEDFDDLNASVTWDAARTRQSLQRVEAKADKAAQDYDDLNASITRDAARTRQGMQRVEAKADKAEEDVSDLSASVTQDATRIRQSLQRLEAKADKAEDEYGMLNASIALNARRTDQGLRLAEAKADAAEQNYSEFNVSITRDVARMQRSLMLADAMGYNKLNASLTRDAARVKRGLQIAEAKANAAEQEYGELDKSLTREEASTQRSLQLARARANRQKQDIEELNSTIAGERSVGQRALRHALDAGEEVSKLNGSFTGEHAVVQQTMRRALDVGKDLRELNRSLVAQRTAQQQALHRAVSAGKGDLQAQMRHVAQDVAATQGELERVNRTAIDASSAAKAAMLGVQQSRQELEKERSKAAAPPEQGPASSE